MNRQIENLADRLATGRIVTSSVAIALAIYAYMLTVSIPTVRSYSDGLELFDMRPTGYSFEDAQSLLAALGQSGRDAYLTHQIPVDMMYPAFFGVSSALLLLFLFRKAFAANSFWRRLWIVPLFAGLFDYLENIGIIVMIQSYPNLSTITVQISSWCSVLKAALTTLFWILLIGTLIRMVFQKLARSG